MKFSDLIAQVSSLAESLFEEVEGFKQGKLTVEIEGNVKILITFEKDIKGKLRANLQIEPITGEAESPEEKRIEEEETKEEAKVESPVQATEAEEEKKEEESYEFMY